MQSGVIPRQPYRQLAAVRWVAERSVLPLSMCLVTDRLVRQSHQGPSPRHSAAHPVSRTCGFVRLVAGFLQRSVAVLLPRSRRTGCR